MIFKTEMLFNRKAFLRESRETANAMTLFYFSDMNLFKIIAKFIMLFTSVVHQQYCSKYSTLRIFDIPDSLLLDMHLCSEVKCMNIHKMKHKC